MSMVCSEAVKFQLLSVFEMVLNDCNQT